jgi:hypothetical protein
MRTLIICAVGALALAACQRPAEDATETPAATDAAMEATATDATGGSPSGTSTGSTSSSSGSRSTSGAATAAGDASADTAGTAPANEGMPSGPSPTVRDAAKEKAEETNLHPSN